LSGCIKQAESIRLVPDPMIDTVLVNLSPIVRPREYFGYLSGRVWRGRVGAGRTGQEHVHDGDGVVIEDCRHIFRGEFVGCIADEEACLPDSTVANDDTSAHISVSKRS